MRTRNEMMPPADAVPVERPVRPGADTRKLCTCDGAGRGPGRECVMKAGGRLGELWRCAETLPTDVAAARQTAEYWKAEHLAGNARIGELHDEIANLRAALQWYADGLHFDKASPDAWDTVSGEPQNWWCDEAGTATVEDGSIAAMTLRGELTAAQIQALD